jgi:hypothetical protein
VPHIDIVNQRSHASMFRFIASSLIAFAMLFQVQIAAAADPAITAERVMRDCGIWQQIDDMQTQLIDSFDEAAANSEAARVPDLKRRLHEAAASAYATDRLRASVKLELSKRLDEKDAAAALDWCHSPLGTPIVQAEIDSAKVEPQAQIENGKAALAHSNQARRKMIADVMRNTHAAEEMTNMTISTTLAMASGLAIASSDDAQVDIAGLRANLESNRPAMLQSFSAIILPTMAATYAAIPDSGIAAYLSYLKSGPGARFTEASIRSLEVALKGAAARFGSAIPATRRDRSI